MNPSTKEILPAKLTRQFFKAVEYTARANGKRGLRAHARRMAEIRLRQLIAARQERKRQEKIERRKEERLG